MPRIDPVSTPADSLSEIPARRDDPDTRIARNTAEPLVPSQTSSFLEWTCDVPLAGLEEPDVGRDMGHRIGAAIASTLILAALAWWYLPGTAATKSIGAIIVAVAAAGWWLVRGTLTGFRTGKAGAWPVRFVIHELRRSQRRKRNYRNRRLTSQVSNHRAHVLSCSGFDHALSGPFPNQSFTWRRCCAGVAISRSN